MAKKFLAVAVPTSVANGAAVYVGDMISCTFAIGGTFDATYQLQASFDGGTTFVNIGSAYADAGGSQTVPDAATHIRCTCPADYTSGTPTAGVGGVQA